MRNLLLLFARYGSTILFVVLEFFCFYLIINFNLSQKEIWLHSANLFSGNINSQVNKVESYLNLQSVNDSLLKDNAKLLQTIINYRIYDRENSFQEFESSLDSMPYQLIPASIIDRTVYLRNNYITLNKGEGDGIKTGMGVISNEGVVGIVSNTTERFSKVLLLLHSQSKISAMIKTKEFSGTITWKDADAQIVNLDFIPKYANISSGDTVVTSGFSTAFPMGIEIGYIENFGYEKGSDNYAIDVKLKEDLASVSEVFVIDYIFDDEKSILKNDQEIE